MFSKKADVAYEEIRQDLIILADWFKFTKLAHNLSKTNFMHITSKGKEMQNEVLLIDSIEIKAKSYVTYLGVLFDDKLFIVQTTP